MAAAALKSRLVCLLAVTVIAALLVGPADRPRDVAVSATGRSAAAGGAPVAYAGDPVRARTSSRIAANARVAMVYTGTTIRLVGSVVTRPRRGRAKPRPVALMEKVSGRWRVIARKKSTRVGAFTFMVKAGSVARTRTFRVQAGRFNGLRAVATRALIVRVVKAPSVPPRPPVVPETPTGFDTPEPLPAGYVGLGAATDWTYLFPGGSRWNPCRTIRWAYNPAAQGYDALPDVKRAFARLSGISGLRFKYVGATTWRFAGDIQDPAFPASQYDIGVGWSDDLALPRLAGNVVGIGGGLGYGAQTPGADVTYRMTRGYLILDNGHVLSPGYTQLGWGAVMMHEILHSLGLGHAQEPVQLMYGTMTEQNISPGAGDITGMKKVGAASGCLS